MGLEGGMVFYQVFLLSALQCTVTEQETVRDCVSQKKYKSQGKAVELTVNSKEENFWLDFIQEFGLRDLSIMRTLEQGHIKKAPNCYIGMILKKLWWSVYPGVKYVSFRKCQINTK